MKCESCSSDEYQAVSFEVVHGGGHSTLSVNACLNCAYMPEAPWKEVKEFPGHVTASMQNEFDLSMNPSLRKGSGRVSILTIGSAEVHTAAAYNLEGFGFLPRLLWKELKRRRKS